ncbi:Inorganic phosphate transporter PHO86 [Candida tropicalis]
MAVQKELDLNKPLDSNAAPNLGKTILTPELSKSAIVLHGDRYKQLQAKLTKYVLWHPYAMLAMTTVVPIIFFYSVWDYVSISENLLEFYHLVKKDKKDFIFSILSAFPLFASIFGIFGFLAYIVGEDMGIASKNFAQKYCDYVFGFNIRAFAKNDNNEDKKLAKLGQNTELIIYRESPIAVGSLVVDEDQSTVENFVVKITGVHVRKVFQKVDFDEVLIEWAILRTRELYQEFLVSNGLKAPPENSSILITADTYSFDPEFQKTLQENGFRPIDVSFQLNPFDSAVSGFKERIYKFLNVCRITFGLMLSVSKEDIDMIKDSALSNKDLKVRKRN